MVDEMLVAQAAWLPQYADAIDGAKKRLGAAPPRKSEMKGAATRPVRSVEEVRAARTESRRAASGDPAAA
jgi:alpha-galactosidase